MMVVMENREVYEIERDFWRKYDKIYCWWVIEDKGKEVSKMIVLDWMIVWLVVLFIERESDLKIWVV